MVPVVVWYGQWSAMARASATMVAPAGLPTTVPMVESKEERMAALAVVLATATAWT